MVKLGHAFLNAVRAGKLPGVIDTGTKKGAGDYICGNRAGSNIWNAIAFGSTMC